MSDWNEFSDAIQIGWASYSDFYFQIEKNEVFERLLFGIFPVQIPSVICPDSFAKYFADKGVPEGDEADHEYIRYSTLRNTNVVRRLGIPNPRNYVNLCSHIADNWEDICNHMKIYSSNQNHKVSRIHIRRNSEGYRLFKMGYKQPDLDGYPEDIIKIGKRFKVSLDIAQFYPSIYSHSLTWALMNKDIAKKEQNDKTRWENRLDFYSRRCKNNETNGLLIGPDSSSILSELILCVVDYELVECGFQYIRNIDDFTGYFDSLGEAEKFIRSTRNALSKFELQLNDKKTVIEEAPVPPDSNWIASFRRYEIKHTYSKTVEDAKEQYLKTIEVKNIWTLAVELFLQNGKDSAILNYAIKTISGYSLGYNALRYHILQCLHMTILYPYLCPILEMYLFDKYNVPKTEIKKFAKELCLVGVKDEIVQALTFSLTWCVKYNIELDKAPKVEDVVESNDCVLLLIDLLYRRQFKDKRSIKAHENHMKVLKGDSFSRHWLYLYEGMRVTQLKGVWRKMKEAGVSFVNLEPKFWGRRDDFSFLEIF